MKGPEVAGPFGTGHTTTSGMASLAGFWFHGPVIHHAESPPVKDSWAISPEADALITFLSAIS